ncbi:PIN domain-containing protein [Variovorax sp. J31P179]|uniref:PIN domain-containing protein n=1 Tax=Variovorax sp. J31P179 TaxID=3053508 RepID=UPI0025754ACB|nr:PIN domain-containing protein [Variovorax sp. J31P179]MDM0081701.1 PIN domain-containing protein [Variovorax sp. J31P179]
MATGVHLLVDLENVQPSPKEVEAWLGDAGEAWVFYGPNQLKRKAGFEVDSPRSTLIPISRTGSNSLDFHLVFYLGYLAAKHPSCRFVVLAKDTGYDPPIAHARTLAFSVRRMNSLPVVTKLVSSFSKENVPGPGKKPKSTAAPKKKVIANAQATQSQNSSATHQGPGAQRLPASVKSAEKLPIAMYRALLKDFKAPNRPKSLTALKRHIQTKFGPAPVPQKVQLLIDRLQTSDVISVVDGKLRYGSPQA